MWFTKEDVDVSPVLYQTSPFASLVIQSLNSGTALQWGPRCEAVGMRHGDLIDTMQLDSQWLI